LKKNVIKVTDLTVAYGRLSAVKNVNFDVYEGEIIAIVGPNGAGKTTLLEAITGIIKQKEGTIEFLGQQIDQMSVFERRHMGMFLVPQEKNIFPWMSVLKNLQVCSLLNTKTKTAELIDYVYKLFPILKERQKQVANTLSGGQQKMLAIGMGITSHSRLLLIDEPSIGLAPKLVTRVLETLKKINSDINKTIVLSEQNIKVLNIADRIYGLEAGKVRLSESIENLGKEEIKDLYLGKIYS